MNALLIEESEDNSRFNLSHRAIEYLLAQRGIVVIHESTRLWCDKFGSY